MVHSDHPRSFVWAMLGGVLVMGLVLAGFMSGCKSPAQLGDSKPRVASDDLPIVTVTTRPAAEDTATQAMQALLDKRLPELRFDGVALSDVIDFLRDVSGVSFTVDWEAIEAAGIEKTATVNMQVRNIEFRKVLRMILGGVDFGKSQLAYTVDDGYIVISTAEDIGKNHTQAREYDIREILACTTYVSDVAEVREPAVRGDAKHVRPNESLLRDVINTVLETVDRESWTEYGGKVGRIKFVSGQLIITQTAENHRQIVALLDKMRKHRGLRVSMHLRFIKIRPMVLGKLGIDEKIVQTTEKTPAGKTTRSEEPKRNVVLDEAKVADVLRAAAEEQNGTIASTQQMTLYDGQEGTVCVGTERVHVSGYRQGGLEWRLLPIRAIVLDGIDIWFQPTISADRKSVTVKLHPRVAELRGMHEELWDEAPAGKKLMVHKPDLAVREINSTVSIPDGQTLVMVLPKPTGKNAETDMVTLFTARPTIIVPREPEQAAPAKP